jgi:hypothetical protein
MTLVLVMILAALFSVRSVAVLVGHRPGGRVGDARICRLAMRPPIVGAAEGRRIPPPTLGSVGYPPPLRSAASRWPAGFTFHFRDAAGLS